MDIVYFFNLVLGLLNALGILEALQLFLLAMVIVSSALFILRMLRG